MWTRFNYFIGSWQGSGEGKAGISRVERTYEYVLNELAEDSQTLRFITEGIENILPGWIARETYQILSPDEFVEVFELAGPDKEFEVYSENRFQRVGSE